MFKRAALALLSLSATLASAQSTHSIFPLLPPSVSTVPSNGDVNCLTASRLRPRRFNQPGGILQPGDILVSNFNNSQQSAGDRNCDRAHQRRRSGYIHLLHQRRNQSGRAKRCYRRAYQRRCADRKSSDRGRHFGDRSTRPPFRTRSKRRTFLGNPRDAGYRRERAVGYGHS